MSSEETQTLVRAALKLAAGALGYSAYVNDSTASAIASMLVALGTVAWGWYSARKAAESKAALNSLAIGAKPCLALPRVLAKTSISWPSYQGLARPVGVSSDGKVAVYVDASLGDAALQNAKDLLLDAPRIVAANDAQFGTRGQRVNVIIFALGGATDGTGGADHMGCNYTEGQNIEVCASFGNSMRCSALFEAELSECSMGGNVCGLSTGESLSRWLANVIGNNVLADFATAPGWAADGYRNFVDTTAQSDQDSFATGCGMAFISWLRSLDIPLPDITKAVVSLGDSGTLAQVYGEVTGDPVVKAWSQFLTACKALPNGIQNDDPFAKP